MKNRRSEDEPTTSNSDSINEKTKKKTRPVHQSHEKNKAENLKLFLIPITILIGIAISVYYNIWMIGRVITPLNEPKIISSDSYTQSENLDRYWGSYRFLKIYLF
jgi:hypothetical protein